jgi:UDP-2,3-diacylglucosamine pyrophosphatase LpxH
LNAPLTASSSQLKFRTIWISDIHLGTRGCKAEFLLDFFRHTESQYLYLVGDIIDIWRLQRSWYWDQSHNDVVQKLLRKARKGTRVYFIPGNHDERIRDFGRHRFGNMTVVNEVVHVTADRKRFLVLHGDQFDAVVKYAKWLAFMGDHAYSLLLALNRWFNLGRRALGFGYWSMSSFLKHKVKNAVEYISRFEELVVNEARKRGVDGVICGHIHHAAIEDHDGILYCNDGDWVESCTALVEHHDGRLEILNWVELRQLSMLETKACESSSLPMPGNPKSTESSEHSAP